MDVIPLPITIVKTGLYNDSRETANSTSDTTTNINSKNINTIASQGVLVSPKQEPNYGYQQKIVAIDSGHTSNVNSATSTPTGRTHKTGSTPRVTRTGQMLLYPINFNFKQNTKQNTTQHVQTTNINLNMNSRGYHYAEARQKQCTIKIESEMTIFFQLINKIFGIHSNEAAKYSYLFSDQKVVLSCFVIMLICWGIEVWLIEDNLFIKNNNILNGLIITLDIILLSTWIIIFLSINYPLLYFKHRSMVLLWKLQNIIVFVIAITYLRYKLKIDSFGDRFIPFTSWFHSISMGLSFIMATYSFSCLQGYNLSNKIKLFGLFLCVIVFVTFSLSHYINVEQDYIAKSLLSFRQDVSLRSIIMTNGIDLALWFSVQFYQTMTEPNVFYLVSKIEINWV